MKPTFTMDSVAVQRGIAARRRRLIERATEAMGSGAERLAERWRSTVPVGPEPTRPAGSAHYRDSIHVDQEHADPLRISFVVGSGVFDGHDDFLEFGTSKMDAQPSARPALHETKEEIKVLAKGVVGGS